VRTQPSIEGAEVAERRRSSRELSSKQALASGYPQAMQVTPSRWNRIRLPAAQRAAAGFVIVLAAGAGTGLGRVAAGLSGSSVTLAAVALVVVGGLIMLGLRRPAALATLGFALLPLVRQEPAPVDLAFALLILCVLLVAQGRLNVQPSIALATAAFAAVTIVSVAGASDNSRAVKYEATTLYLIGTALALSAIFWNVRAARNCIAAYLIGASVSAIAAVLALFVSYPGSHLLLYDPHRVMAFFKDPNVFSGFLVPGIAIVVDELAQPRLLPWGFKTKLATLAALGAGLLFAFSRAAYLNGAIAVATVVAVHAMRRGGGRYAMRLLLAVGLVGSTGVALLVATHSTHFLESRSHLQTYDQQRFATQSEALHSATKHLFGFGPGQVEVNLPLSSHSLYARVAYEQGVPGLITLAVLFGLTLAIALLLASLPSRVGVGGAALLGSWLGLLANSAFIDTLHWRHLWIFGGLIWANFAYSTSRRRAEASLTAVTGEERVQTALPSHGRAPERPGRGPRAGLAAHAEGSDRAD
jgi:hypothetical protein